MAGRLSAAAAATVLVLAACAEPGPPTLEEGSLEAALPASIRPASPGIVTDVVCEGLDVELIAQTTTCRARLDGDPVTVAVEIDETGAATAVVAEPLFEVAEAADQLASQLAADLGIEPPAVDCERAVVVARPGVEFGCTATRDGDPIDFGVRLLDADGTWELLIGSGPS